MAGSRMGRSLGGRLLMTTALSPGLPTTDLSQDVSTVELDEVTLSAEAAQGYVASSSTAGTKTSTPIEETPASI
ncbi:hypothetical protein RGQ15_14800 [Paracoccus sp. MBLB3053]|uniref:Uncharacterized protein n=1 Tax=Paracoccus aurantius TaxID=3073814 RepID=A0ABU2HUV5_9RHOB|nr:hypothetical protein [Paracoccus sp. MBLB3053]MDS9468832.1 hypothetical protein [Paracoccus sp. MBLB3053]